MIFPIESMGRTVYLPTWHGWLLVLIFPSALEGPRVIIRTSPTLRVSAVHTFQQVTFTWFQPFTLPSNTEIHLQASWVVAFWPSTCLGGRGMVHERKTNMSSDQNPGYWMLIGDEILAAVRKGICSRPLYGAIFIKQDINGMSAKDVEHFSHGTWDFHPEMKRNIIATFTWNPSFWSWFFLNPRKTNKWQAENSTNLKVISPIKKVDFPASLC